MAATGSDCARTHGCPRSGGDGTALLSRLIAVFHELDGDGPLFEQPARGLTTLHLQVWNPTSVYF